MQRRFKAIPGVVDVSAFGGKTKEFEVAVDLHKLQAQGLTLVQVVSALNNSSTNVGGQTLNVGEQSAVVRGVGLIRDMDDVRNTMITQVNGVPVLIKDVAEVQVSNAPRLGIVGHENNGDNRRGHRAAQPRRPEPADDPAGRGRDREDQFLGHPAAGVKVVPLYDRSALIHTTTHTVMHNLVFGVVLVFLCSGSFSAA